MNKKQTIAQLGWLNLTLVSQRNNIAKILLRLKDVGSRIGTSLGLQRKFLSLLEQISYDREIEQDILHEIEEVERLHKEMKERKMLRRATSAVPVTDRHPELASETDEAAPKRGGLSILFGLLALFAPRGNRKNKQDLTVD